MAKKTTAGKTSSGRKKPAETIEDADVVEEIAPTTEESADPAPEDAASSDAEPEAADAEETATDDAPPVETAAEDTSDTDAEATAEISETAPDGDASSDESAAEDETSEATGEDETVAETDAQETDTTAYADDAPKDEAPSDADASLPVEDTPATEPAPAPAPSPGQDTSDQGGKGALALIFGGVVAAAVGFFAAYLSGGINPPPPPPEPVDLSGIEQTIVAQDQRIEELAASIPDVPEVTAPDLSGIEAEIAAVSSALGDLEARVTALENRPAVEGGTVDPGLMDEIAALKSTITALQEDNETAKANARSAAEATLKRAALTQVQTALDTGGPLTDGLAELESFGIEVPAALSALAEDGVPTLTSLQEAFPEAARAALAADRAEAAANGETGGLGDFLRSQLGARSLTPQEGDGTDAVLSRAEAALKDGQIADALAELETLPEVAQPAMADWSTLATARADALAAAQTLSDSLN